MNLTRRREEREENYLGARISGSRIIRRALAPVFEAYISSFLS
jgi:hypothetical protein